MNTNVEQRRIISPAFKEFIILRGRQAFVNSLVGTHLGTYLFKSLWKALLCGRNIEMMYVRTLPSMIMCSGHVRKKGRDTVKRTEMEEDVSSEMGKIRSQ